MGYVATSRFSGCQGETAEEEEQQICEDEEIPVCVCYNGVLYRLGSGYDPRLSGPMRDQTDWDPEPRNPSQEEEEEISEMGSAGGV